MGWTMIASMTAKSPPSAISANMAKMTSARPHFMRIPGQNGANKSSEIWLTYSRVLLNQSCSKGATQQGVDTMGIKFDDNGTTRDLTVADMLRPEFQESYSDLFKSLYGFRPR